jgi:hypothetical protein
MPLGGKRGGRDARAAEIFGGIQATGGRRAFKQGVELRATEPAGTLIEDPPVIVKILSDLGLPTRTPLRSIPNDLRNRSGLSTQSDGAARSELQ